MERFGIFLEKIRKYIYTINTNGAQSIIAFFVNRAITNKINGAIIHAKNDELTGLLINPGPAQFYKELGDSVRATVRELRELNTAVNGKQDGALEGLKALAGALCANQSTAPAVVDEQTTTMFDD